MQQATTAKPPNDSAPSGAVMPQQSLRNRFVINLCGSTTPVSLTPPDHAGLKRFTFFVSRRREEGRERFRLHMGYFNSQEEAERLLDIVREIYPAAWAGLAPGQRLAQAEAEQAAAAAEPVAAQQPLATPPVEATIAVVAAAPMDESTVEQPALSLLPDQGRRAADAVLAKKEDHDAAARALSNVRAAIASLEDTSTGAPTLSPLPELKPAAKPQAPPVSNVAPAAAAEAREISDSVALRVLESRDKGRSDSTVKPSPEPAASSKSDKAVFAVQLLWSVQPIDIAQIPQLAIFSAYILYGAEGNRDGRRWYGVRLGFFTDAVSAKQVAHYVRSDFSTVSVVPVTTRERERATLAATRPDATPVAAAALPAAAATAVLASSAAAFEFIEDKQQPSQVRTAAAGATPAARSSRGAPGKRAKARAGRQINGRSKAKSMTLEETLEILGAGQLKMDEGRRASINDGLAQLPASDASKGKPSRFGRLLERLSERLGS